MKYTARVNSETGKLDWVDAWGDPCDEPADAPKSNHLMTHHKPKGWPLLCEASGCHPSQIEEFTRMMSDAGVPTEFTRDGRAIYTSRRHRKRSMEARHIFDKDGGPGDASPT